jgi:hypothetical protein
MRGLMSKNYSYQLSLNNNAVQYHQKQQRNDQSFSVLNINGKSRLKNMTENDCDITVRRVNEYSYMVSCDNSQQETDFHSRKLTLTDIHTEFLYDKKNLLTSQGFIHIKEYLVDSYECRCHEHNDLLNTSEIDNDKQSSDYKMEF